MKQIIIALLLLILLVFCYIQYSEYKRFSLAEYEYIVPEKIVVNETNKALALDYYEAVEEMNGYVISQWSFEGIDVRNPEDDSKEDLASVAIYRKKMANVKFYESQLLNPPKSIKIKEELSAEEKKKHLIKKMFFRESNSMKIGDKNALVYEIQKLLNKSGDSIKIDGFYNTETYNAIKTFEEKKGLFPDGNLDAITLDYLLR